ncbi:FAD-dependent oxidoreductase [Rhodocaloribacter sp.]
MFDRDYPEVLVVGAGPVGQAAALTLARRGIRVAIVDREWRTGAHSYALALHPRSLALLDELGVLPEVLERAHRVRSVGLYEGPERRGELHVSELGGDFSFLAVMRQDALENLFEQALRDQGVKIQWNHQVVSLIPERDHVEATVDHLEKSSFGYAIAHTEWIVLKSLTVDVPFVIGADGHQSLVRRTLGIDFREVAEPEHFAVFEFDSDADLGHEMRLVLEPETSSVLWPLPGGRLRWSFQLKDWEEPLPPREKDRVEVQIGAARYPVLSEERLRAFIRERAPWFDGSIDEIRWRMVVRFDRRLADAFGKQRMWLAGDAGHMTGPVGIQSMNVGLREAWNLANIVADVIEGKASPEALAAYNEERLAEWRFLLGLEGGLEPGPDAEAWIRPYAGRLLSALPASGSDLAALARQLGFKVRSGVAVH